MPPWLTQQHRNRRSILSKLIETFEKGYIRFSDWFTDAKRLLATCERMAGEHRIIPYVIFSGLPKSKDLADDVLYASKPASHAVIVGAMERLIGGTDIEP